MRLLDLGGRGFVIVNALHGLYHHACTGMYHHVLDVYRVTYYRRSSISTDSMSQRVIPGTFQAWGSRVRKHLNHFFEGQAQNGEVEKSKYPEDT